MKAIRWLMSQIELVEQLNLKEVKSQSLIVTANPQAHNNAIISIAACYITTDISKLQSSLSNFTTRTVCRKAFE